MKNSSAPNVRLVRCPKCKEVLPEPADVPFYRCGGCDTILQAKHYKKANVAEDNVHGGEASSSNPPPFMNQNEGLNQSNAQSGNLEQPGVSNSSREASTSSQPKQQLPSSSSSQHFLDRDEEVDQILEVTNTLREDSSLNEPSPPSHEEPFKSVPETYEVEADPRYTEQHGDSEVSSSDESMQQLPVPQIVLEGGDVRQHAIVVDEQLETADSSSGAASFEVATAKTDWEAHELNQNAGKNCRLEQPRVSSFPIAALLSNEPSLHETNSSSRVPAEEEQVDSTDVKEHLEVSAFRSESTLSNEPTVGEDELSLQLGSPKDVMKEQHLVANSWERRPESGVESEGEISSTNDPFSVLKKNGFSQFVTANQEGVADTMVDICGTDGNVYSHIVTSSVQSTLLENKELSQLVAENKETDDEGTVQNELGICIEDQDVDNLTDEIISPAGVNSKMTDKSAFVLPEAEEKSGSNLSSKSEVLTAPDENKNKEPQHSAEGDAPADGNNMVPALPTLKTTVGAEVLNLDDRSQKIVKTSPREEIEELQKAAPGRFGTTEAVDTHFEASTSYGDLPKSPANCSLAYDGSVSSYDGNDQRQGMNKIESPTAEGQRQHLPERNMTYGGSGQHKMDNLQEVSVGEDVDHHSEAQSTPIMLNEIKMSEVLSDASYTRRIRRPRTQEFPSRVPLYGRSPERRYESGDLVHKDFYDHPTYYPPPRYRDVESMVTRRHVHRSNVDGRMISEAVWMGEEFHMRPYHDSSSEIYPNPRQQMYYHGRRQPEYQPQVHSMPRVPYSGKTVRSGYRVLDSYSHLYPGDMRWSSHLPSPALSYSRGWYGPREPFDSYNASPQVFTDSDYYARSHDTISEDQRHTDQRMSRLQLRRSSQPVRHFQPIGGAAPFIACYQCSELLQLPSDFLLFKGNRIHRVKCCACSKILKFTLEKGRHLVPYTPKPIAPLRDYIGKAGAEKLLKSTSSLQANHDYEALHRRSASISMYSGNSQAQISENMSLRSPSQAPERQRSNVESNHSQDKGKRIMAEMHKHSHAAGSSPPRQTKVTWKEQDRSSSPLHRLMGYSSPSAVLYNYGSSDNLEIQPYSRN